MGKINSLLDHGVILVSTSDFSFSLLICQFFKENNKLLHEGCKIKWQGWLIGSSRDYYDWGPLESLTNYSFSLNKSVGQTKGFSVSRYT